MKPPLLKGIPLAQRNWVDINPCDLGQERCLPGHSYGPAIRNNYLIHYVVSGKGTFFHNGNAYPVKAGEIFVIFPREVTTYAADQNDPWHYIWIGFTGTLAERLASLPTRVCSYSANTFFEMMHAESLTGTREEFVTAKIFEMMSVLFEGQKKVTHYEQQALNYVNANYMNPITVDSISAYFNLDRRYLSKLFKNRMGITLSDYLIQTRLQHAALLLADGYSVNNAATMAGYHDPFNFSKMFKKNYGISPTEYRKRHMQNK